MRTRLSSLLPLAILALGCETLVQMEPACESVKLSLNVPGFSGVSRSGLGASIEDVFSGGALAVYDSGTGLLCKTFPLTSLDDVVDASLPSGRTYDLFALANLKKIRVAGGSVSDYAFPQDEDELLSSWVYLDGRSCGDGFRFENFSEASIFGIPMAGCLLSVNPSTVSSVTISLERLFARINVTIDHGDLDSGLDSGCFRNVGLHVKQANAGLRPFGDTGSRAASTSDVMAVSDGESPMTNGHCSTFTFYVPENLQGNLLPSNTDPALKTGENVDSVNGAGTSSLLTYLEFTAVVDGDRSGGGYGGTLDYRFFLGYDNSRNFDIRRNVSYSIVLGFTVDGIFSPNWKIEPAPDFQDARKFCLVTGRFSATELPDGKVIAVRPSKPATFGLYINREGTLGENGNELDSNNSFSRRPALVDGVHSSSSLEELSWTSNLHSATLDAANAPLVSQLSQYGITVNYPAFGGLFALVVTDPSRFVPGIEFEARFTLFPGNRTITARIRTCPDIVVREEEGRSLSNGFYTGMKRSLKVSGLVGENVTFRFGASGIVSGAPSYSETPYLSGREYGMSAGQLASEGIPLYARGVAGSGTLTIVSEDPFNDNIPIQSLTVRKPQLTNTGTVYCMVPMDGTPVPYRATCWADANGNVMDLDLFDQANYDAWLGLRTTMSGDYGNYTLTDETVCMRRITSSQASVEMRPARAEMGSGTLLVNFLPGVPEIGRAFADYTDCNYFDVFGPSSIERTARVNLKGNDASRVAISLSGGEYSNRAVATLDSTGALTWTYSSNSGNFFYGTSAPYGNQTVTLTFTNSISRETYSLQYNFNMGYTAHIGCVAVYREGFPNADVYLGTPKALYERLALVQGTISAEESYSVDKLCGNYLGSNMRCQPSCVSGTVTGCSFTMSPTLHYTQGYPHGSSTWHLEQEQDCWNNHSIVSSMYFNSHNADGSYPASMLTASSRSWLHIYPGTSKLGCLFL